MLAEYNNICSSTLKTLGGTLASGTAYTAGMIVQTTGAGTWDHAAIVENAANMIGVLIEDYDATLANLPAVIVIKGEFNPRKLIFAGGQSYATVKGALNKAGIIANTNWELD